MEPAKSWTGGKQTGDVHLVRIDLLFRLVHLAQAHWLTGTFAYNTLPTLNLQTHSTFIVTLLVNPEQIFL